MNSIPVKGSLAICGLGCLGIIIDDEKRIVKYPDGNEGRAYIGIHATDKIANIGEPWSSRNPKIIGHINDLLRALDIWKEQQEFEDLEKYGEEEKSDD